MTSAQKVRKARYVFGWVSMFNGDGSYIQLQKQSVLESLREYSIHNSRKEATEVTKEKFVLRQDGDLYIG